MRESMGERACAYAYFDVLFITVHDSYTFQHNNYKMCWIWCHRKKYCYKLYIYPWETLTCNIPRLFIGVAAFRQTDQLHPTSPFLRLPIAVY